MTNHFRNILHGIGSVLDIFPQTDYQKLVPKETIEERTRKTWERVGKSIESSIGKIACEQENKK